MCGRFSYDDRRAAWVRGEAAFDERGDPRKLAGEIPDPPDLQDVYPAQQAPIIVNEGGRRRLQHMEWGVIPIWAKPLDGRKPKGIINARDDKLLSSRLWRRLMSSSRCVIPANGYYEWTGPKGSRQAWHFRLKSREQFAFAGLHEVWEGPQGVVKTCAIVTTSPNAVAAPIHDRMPVILGTAGSEEIALWLDPATTEPERLMHLVRPYPAAEMEAFPAEAERTGEQPEGVQLALG